MAAMCTARQPLDVAASSDAPRSSSARIASSWPIIAAMWNALSSGCSWLPYRTWREEEEWGCQLDRQRVRCPRLWRLELRVCTPAQPRPRGELASLDCCW
jgi:hypothetical protein